MVYDCLQVLSQTIGALPFAIFERRPDGSKLRRDDHPLMRVLRDPNPETTDIEFMGQLVFDLASEGDGIDDSFFSLDARNKGFEIYADTAIKCLHLIKGRNWYWKDIVKQQD